MPSCFPSLGRDRRSRYYVTRCIVARSSGGSVLDVRVERELVHFAAGVLDPAIQAADREERTGHRELDERGHAHEQERYAHGGEQRQDRRAGEVDLLADRRELGVEGAHETYTAATTNVMPNMNMQIAHTIRPVRMFLRARRRVIIGGS